VGNFQSEKQQRLLVNSLHENQAVPQSFVAAANVGIALKQPPLVPDVFLSLGVQPSSDRGAG